MFIGVHYGIYSINTVLNSFSSDIEWITAMLNDMTESSKNKFSPHKQVIE
jgi:hypothetical protein